MPTIASKEKLINPKDDMKRYDDRYMGIKYNCGNDNIPWAEYNVSVKNRWNGTQMQTYEKDASIEFYFYGNKF